LKRVAILLLLLAACSKRYEKAEIAAQTGGDAARGRQLVQQYGCTSCHDIPRVSGPRGMVGPPLTHFASRQMIAGKLPNTPENLMKYLQNPQLPDPANAMPNLNITVDQSRDMAAFLYTLK
jgi:cytochrome c2